MIFPKSYAQAREYFVPRTATPSITCTSGSAPRNYHDPTGCTLAVGGTTSAAGRGFR